MNRITIWLTGQFAGINADGRNYRLTSRSLCGSIISRFAIDQFFWSQLHVYIKYCSFKLWNIIYACYVPIENLFHSNPQENAFAHILSLLFSIPNVWHFYDVIQAEQSSIEIILSSRYVIVIGERTSMYNNETWDDEQWGKTLADWSLIFELSLKIKDQLL